MTIEWNDTRANLHDLLRREHVDVADLYLRALMALYDEPLTRPGLAVAGHCIRELFSVLPQVRGVANGSRINESRATKELSGAWSQAGLEFGEDGVKVTPGNKAIPDYVFEAAQGVARVGTQVGLRSRELTALVISGRASDHETVPVGLAHQSLEFFRSWAHTEDYSQPQRPLPDVTEVEKKLETLETALTMKYDNRAEGARVVRQALNEANARLEVLE